MNNTASTETLVKYKEMPEWNTQSLPKGFKRKHNTKIGTWGKLIIHTGKLNYDELDENGNILSSQIFDSHSETPFIEPQAWHRVEALDEDLRCQLSFYCQPEDYDQKVSKFKRSC